MKKYFLFALFFLASCTPQADLKPKQEINSDLFSKEIVLNFSAETVCALMGGGKNASLRDFATKMEAINKKYNIDPKNSAQKEKLKKSLAEYKKDKQFAIDLQNKMKALCGLQPGK